MQWLSTILSRVVPPCEAAQELKKSNPGFTYGVGIRRREFVTRDFYGEWVHVRPANNGAHPTRLDERGTAANEWIMNGQTT